METIETERVLVRRFREDDGEELFSYLSDPEVVKYEPYHPFTREAAFEEARRRAEDPGFWAVCMRTGELIGNLYFSQGEFETWELGYVFNRNFWGRGYAAESARALLRYGFESLGVRRVVAYCNPENESSWRLMERLGMRREGYLLENVWFFRDEQNQPIWQNSYEYGLLRREWGETQKG